MKYQLKKVATAVTATLLGSAISVNISAFENSVSLNASNGQSINAKAQQSPLAPRYIVKYKTNNGLTSSTNASQAMHSKARQLGAKVAKEFHNINVLAVEMDEAALAAFQADPNVEYVEVDAHRRLMAETIPYGISMVQADQINDSVAAASAGGKKVCVIDSGLEMPHADMGNQGGSISGSNNSGTGNWYDHGGPHGTHVAGTIGALTNGVGVRGVIGSDVALHIVKVFNESGWGYSSTLASAVNTCVSNGANVINMSLGGAASNTTEANAMQSASDAGVLLIAAAGNDGVVTNTTDAMSYPASYDSVVSVAGVDYQKGFYTASQKNSQVEIAAPGVDVFSTYPDGLGLTVALSVGANSFEVNGLENRGSANGDLFNFGTGEATNSGAAGRVCLIQRGAISFHDKVQNCQNSGGVAAIIYNNEAGSLSATLGETNATTIPAVGATQADGNVMLGQIGQSTNVNVSPGDYGKMTGTSMASPHVAGVAALVWSTHPTCTNTEIRAVLNATAEDLGAAGRDVQFGYGLVQAKDAIDYITNNGCDGSGGTPPPTGGNELQNGVAKTSLAAAKSEEVAFTMQVPAGATGLSFVTNGGSGDADLYVKFGSAPTTASYDCRPYKTGNAETCTISNVQAGTYHVMVRAYSAFSGLSLVGSYTEGTPGGGLQPINTTVNNISVARNAWTSYTVDLADGYADLTVTMSGGTGDADLYVRRGAKSTTSAYDCRPYKNGNSETCTFSAPQAGTWYIDIRGYSAASGVTLKVTANP